MKKLKIDIVFPAFDNKEFADFDLYSKYYELYTCMQILLFLEKNFEQFTKGVLDVLKDEFNRRLALLEFRAVLGTYTYKTPLEPELQFEEYEIINSFKSLIIESTEYDEVSLNYIKDNSIYKEKNLFVKFINNEPSDEEDLQLSFIKE